jgi:hypothetical protein
MILGPVVKTMVGYPRTADPDPSQPYVMWPGTPYEHLMIPVKRLRRTSASMTAWLSMSEHRHAPGIILRANIGEWPGCRRPRVDHF